MTRKILLLAIAWVAFCTVIASAFAGDKPAEDRLEEARERFDNVAASASGQFQSLDSIEARLKQDGLSLHPQLVTLRARIGASLDEAHRAIDRGDLKAANRAMKTAEELVQRLAHRLGG